MTSSSSPTKQCLTVTSVIAGESLLLSVGGMKVLTADALGLTDGVVGGPVQWTVCPPVTRSWSRDEYRAEREQATYGRGLALDDGDLVLEAGRLVEIAGLAALRQDLQLRLTTPLASDRLDVRYGLDVRDASPGGCHATLVKEVLRLTSFAPSPVTRGWRTSSKCSSTTTPPTSPRTRVPSPRRDTQCAG